LGGVGGRLRLEEEGDGRDVPHSTQAYHGPSRIGCRLPPEYDATDILDAALTGTRLSNSLPACSPPSSRPSSPPIPIDEILENHWPGSRTFQAICTWYVTVKLDMKKKGEDKKLFPDAFRDFYGFDVNPKTWNHHTGFLKNPRCKHIVEKYRRKPDALWRDFAYEARKAAKGSTGAQ